MASIPCPVCHNHYSVCRHRKLRPPPLDLEKELRGNIIAYPWLNYSKTLCNMLSLSFPPPFSLPLPNALCSAPPSSLTSLVSSPPHHWSTLYPRESQGLHFLHAFWVYVEAVPGWGHLFGFRFLLSLLAFSWLWSFVHLLYLSPSAKRGLPFHGRTLFDLAHCLFWYPYCDLVNTSSSFL